MPVMRRLRCSSAAGFSSSLQGPLLGRCWLTHCLGIEKAGVVDPGAVREHPGNCVRLLVSKEKGSCCIAVILLILWLLGFGAAIRSARSARAARQPATGMIGRQGVMLPEVSDASRASGELTARFFAAAA